ncbi:hypothetical protein B4102_0179 [Heyndrickxia sporothermodurans]|uniref:Uncharacterized protein n=1 Tax=Heyndrickxia sporothermodurans TaxID=46224 RepID=A0A150LGP5_9BACI|nr:hypothetical protein B4102_0179 [Heyndrickxia sporothermodurans]
MKPRQQTFRSTVPIPEAKSLKIRRDPIMEITPLLIYVKRVFYFE